MNVLDDKKLLTIEEFARRFGVSRTTIFKWKKRGKLKPGRHYVMIGRVLRFFWNKNVIVDLHDVNDKRIEKQNVHLKEAGKTRPKCNKGSPINFDY